MNRRQVLKNLGVISFLSAASCAGLSDRRRRAGSVASSKWNGRWAEPLAQDYQALAESPDPQNVFMGSPSILKLSHGRLLASFEQFKRGGADGTTPQCRIVSSDDGGRTWTHRGSNIIMWGTLFEVGGCAYLIGNHVRTRDILIARSRDQGVSWSEPLLVIQGAYVGGSTSVAQRGNFIYRAFEESRPRNQWPCLVVAGDTARDLLDPAAWRKSNSVDYPGTPPSLSGRRFPEDYPNHIPADGWLEANVIEVSGRLRVMSRVRMDGEATAGMTAVCNLEDDGRQLNLRFGQFYPMPGGQCKFHILQDPVTGYYWTTVTVPTDTMQDPKPMWEKGFFGSPGNERRVLMLMYSLDALNWLMAGCVAMSRSPLESFSYASQTIAGQDLLVLARTSRGGKNQHDTNMITLHRVRDFRSLALDLRPAYA
jgi:hypothetical protein